MDFKPIGLCSTIQLIVDDTNAYVAITFTIEAKNQQQDRDKLTIWDVKWLFIQTNETSCLSLEVKIRSNLWSSWSSTRVIRKSQYLGLIIRQCLKWKKKHLNNVCTKANKTLDLLRLHPSRDSRLVAMYKGNNKITEQSYKGKVKTHKYINR